MARRTPKAGPEASTAIPLPPWQRPAPQPARAPLTREAIVDAALVVLDKVGMDGLSMRRVAEELGTGAASLYWHVRNKEELLQLIFDRVMDGFTLPAPDPAHWQEQLRAAANQALAALTRHRDVGRISLGRVPGGPQSAVIGEWFFTLLAPVGIPDRVIAYLGDFFGLYVGAYAFEQSLGIASPTGEEMAPEAIAKMLEDYVKSLPADRFPYVTRAAHLLFGGDRQERWDFGLDLMLRGLESYVAVSRGRKGGNARDVAAPRSLTRKGT